MKSLSQKNKYSAMNFARQNANIECVLYAKAGTIGNDTPTVLKTGSFTYLDCLITLQRIDSRKVNIVTKSFYDDVVSQKWLLNNRDTDFNKINTI
tara:strand:+ start:141 stop:425 length:285 start_codon:yes stop_codon:yes gene_type:complete